MTLKQKVLEQLTKPELYALGKAFELPVAQADAVDDLRKTINGSKKATLDKLLAEMKLEQLKGVCDALEVAKSGAKQELVDRILGKLPPSLGGAKSFEAWPTTRKGQALAVLTKAQLLRIVEAFDLGASSSLPVDELRALVRKNKAATLPRLLSRFSLEELRKICDGMELPKSGSKPDVITRIVGVESDRSTPKGDDRDDGDDVPPPPVETRAPVASPPRTPVAPAPPVIAPPSQTCMPFPEVTPQVVAAPAGGTPAPASAPAPSSDVAITLDIEPRNPAAARIALLSIERAILDLSKPVASGTTTTPLGSVTEDLYQTGPRPPGMLGKPARMWPEVMEVTEALIGSALVVAQAHIIATGKNSPITDGIKQVANYWKHRSDWGPPWGSGTGKPHPNTLEAIKKLGATPPVVPGQLEELVTVALGRRPGQPFDMEALWAAIS